ncbi:MAG: FAD-binding protein [Beijerinckiaceae bacterium]
MKQNLSRRSVIAGSLALAAGSTLRSGKALARQRLVLNDASKLSATPVFNHWIANKEPEAEWIARLRSELGAAVREKRPLGVSAARHSMGGQALPRDGHAITLDINTCQPDTAKKTFRVNGGTRWFEVIAHLDKIGFSPAVMQSNSDFGVAATFSVSAHGWPMPYGPFGATVRSLRIMLADGSIVNCSRTENAELFGLAMGGYGLVGIILDLEVDMVENRLMRPRFEAMPAEDFAKRFVAAIETDKDVKMIYGRLNVAREEFFREALLVTYRAEPTPAAGLPGINRGGGIMSGILRDVYRAQIGSEAAKRMRWYAERSAAPAMGAGLGTRNNLMNEPVLNLEGKDPTRTDILHEYFVAPERFNDFLTVCRSIIPKSHLEFLNVTLRFVRKDETSTLAYAKTDRIAAVMSFSQRMNGEDEAEMMRVTEALIEGMAGIGGSFYLPYRLHARRDQVARIYPNTNTFIARKQHYDPGMVFRNALWDTYFSGQ